MPDMYSFDCTDILARDCAALCVFQFLSSWKVLSNINSTFELRMANIDKISTGCTSSYLNSRVHDVIVFVRDLIVTPQK